MTYYRQIVLKIFSLRDNEKLFEPFLLLQKRRSNRQVKRKKYTEDLDIKITDDEEEEEVDVTGPIKTEPILPEPVQEPDGETLPSMQFFVVSWELEKFERFVLLLRITVGWLHLFLQENPSEEDAAIVDKVLSMRIVKKEVRASIFNGSP